MPDHRLVTWLMGRDASHWQIGIAFYVSEHDAQPLIVSEVGVPTSRDKRGDETVCLAIALACSQPGEVTDEPFDAARLAWASSYACESLSMLGGALDDAARFCGDDDQELTLRNGRVCWRSGEPLFADRD
jgi:hypothetical protein